MIKVEGAVSGDLDPVGFKLRNTPLDFCTKKKRGAGSSTGTVFNPSFRREPDPSFRRGP